MRTWAPRGHTPILRLPFSWRRLSVIGALAVAPNLSRVRTFLSFKPGSVDGPTVIAFLRSLRRHVSACGGLLVWDRLPAHVSRLTRDWIASQRHWLEVEWLPPYAPELNPVECLWGHLDATHLANFAPDDLAELEAQVRRGVRQVRRRDDLALLSSSTVGSTPSCIRYYARLNSAGSHPAPGRRPSLAATAQGG